jgi:GNAT superfamily N-acetyltransferase
MKLVAGDLELEVREGTVEDVPLLVSFVTAMSEYEKVPFAATADDFRRALFGPEPAARTWIVLHDARPIAYVVYYFTFSTMLGRRGLWLEDLFVSAEYRGRGIGGALMRELAQLAVAHECGRFEWAVLDWNEPAIGFYRGLGARFLDEWRVCRLEGGAITAVAEGRRS